MRSLYRLASFAALVVGSILAACALVGGTVAANASPYVVMMDEVGSNVVATGSGNIDLTGLSLFIGDSVDGGAPIGPAIGLWSKR